MVKETLNGSKVMANNSLLLSDYPRVPSTFVHRIITGEQDCEKYYAESGKKNQLTQHSLSNGGEVRPLLFLPIPRPLRPVDKL